MSNKTIKRNVKGFGNSKLIETKYHKKPNGTYKVLGFIYEYWDKNKELFLHPTKGFRLYTK